MDINSTLDLSPSVVNTAKAIGINVKDMFEQFIFLERIKHVSLSLISLLVIASFVAALKWNRNPNRHDEDKLSDELIAILALCAAIFVIMLITNIIHIVMPEPYALKALMQAIHGS